MEMNTKLHDEITEICEEGNELLLRGEIVNARKKYFSALELIPEPKIHWEASTWVYTAIADVYFIEEDYEVSKSYFSSAFKSVNGFNNPFILLRYGQCFFETKDYENAKEYLLRAYMIAGLQIFDGEDKKYYNLIENTINAKEKLENKDSKIEVKTPTRLKLDSETEKMILNIQNKSGIEYQKKDYLKYIEYMLEAWKLLPEPKYKYGESYHIASNICNGYLLTTEKIKAKKWLDMVFKSDLDRIDSGEREFIAGKVMYELEELEKAREYFEISNEKSHGRCFIDEPKKYYNFFNS